MRAVMSRAVTASLGRPLFGHGRFGAGTVALTMAVLCRGLAAWSPHALKSTFNKLVCSLRTFESLPDFGGTTRILEADQKLIRITSHF